MGIFSLVFISLIIGRQMSQSLLISEKPINFEPREISITLSITDADKQLHLFKYITLAGILKCSTYAFNDFIPISCRGLLLVIKVIMNLRLRLF
ncbi:hypothetical protein A2303_04705 [Candidatus Falkowbacteria bacterium RIFOXYB2_FULL_47_14]|uniref:Uncharacterized protein n=1 Tax=Candidatus Falkowbacteria bacterium RIFOXYA2_FULL_47_19 TaxID=1797994 RepID=A0A1F5SHH0_9BACT|nr:MAG: hypothetical protein A2227_02540 [Candidatus Falkowbacteria bacterium RIFOXYA2_FULL_47_19]OGF35802.1 MAG: hypothetical protein A2468_03725 [Candidatus Falkowbacteria bacterium RIFOXYC2_FULL_46_15]OGF42675.1 MAG: hypothetical protein A2303_04705 [Candidatus Falkowbacteria bacterium RIFOXYB2_FULL_47_14]